MLARAAERNPSVFRPSGPAGTLEEIIPQLLNIAEYTDNPWGNTKFLLTQFKPSAAPVSQKSKNEKRQAQDVISSSKSLADVAGGLGVELGKGAAIMAEIGAEIRQRGDVWQERETAVLEGKVVDEVPSDSASAGAGAAEDRAEAQVA